MIYVGTCGYAYKDWVGPFYPPATRPAEMLAYYSRRFAAVEVDMSYYGIPKPQTIAAMNARTPARFRFSFKAPQSVTHVPDPGTHVHLDAKRLREAVEPLRASTKLACILAQFPNGFKRTPQHERYLRRVVEVFEELPVVVEFRNRDWQHPETLALLRELGAGLCNVDLPAFESLPRSSSDATSSIGYVRFHGRNAKTWWTGTNVTRYAYTYTPEELVPWTDRIAEIEAQVEETYVFFNNHARARAAHNAQMLEALLEERFGDEGAYLLAHPEGGAPEQTTLPGMPLHDEEE